MTGRWKAGKSRSRIPLSSHRPLEIPQQRRDFHIPTVPAAVLPGLNIKPKKTGCLTAAPNQHERKNRSQNPHSQGPVFRITLYWKRFRVSGSFYDWKMLSRGFRYARGQACRCAAVGGDRRVRSHCRRCRPLTKAISARSRLAFCFCRRNESKRPPDGARSFGAFWSVVWVTPMTSSTGCTGRYDCSKNHALIVVSTSTVDTIVRRIML